MLDGKLERKNNSVKNMQKTERKIKLIPGKTPKEDRINFIKFWANYIKTHSDKDWSKQQKILLEGQYRKLIKPKS
ncbi:hypothetical protein DRZ77_00060 [Candidatus Woesearchaeota archaeon]|nr:MAG: hypothetical protein DRZ77_00060 [Candidatus Woesearchaeota archaeon]